MLVAPASTILFYAPNLIPAPDRVIMQCEGGLIKASPQSGVYTTSTTPQRLARLSQLVDHTSESSLPHSSALKNSSFLKASEDLSQSVARLANPANLSEKLLDRRELPRLQVETNIAIPKPQYSQKQQQQEVESDQHSHHDSVALNKQLGLIVKPLTEEELMGISLEEAATFMKKGSCPHIRERRVQFVNGLVGFAAEFIYAIWPVTKEISSQSKSKVLSLRNFVEEVLRRSRTSYVTLNAALYYLNKASQKGRSFTSSQKNLNKYTFCGRRMFLASLVLSTKFLQDRAYTNKTWSKISGLPAREVTACEMALIQWMNWELCIPSLSFAKWQQLVLKRVQLPSSPIDTKISGNCCNVSSLEAGGDSTENSPTITHSQFQRYGVLTPHPEPCALGKKIKKLPLEPHYRSIAEDSLSNVFPSPAIGTIPEAITPKKRFLNTNDDTLLLVKNTTTAVLLDQRKRTKLENIDIVKSISNDDDDDERTSNYAKI